MGIERELNRVHNKVRLTEDQELVEVSKHLCEGFYELHRVRHFNSLIVGVHIASVFMLLLILISKKFNLFDPLAIEVYIVINIYITLSLVFFLLSEACVYIGYRESVAKKIGQSLEQSGGRFVWRELEKELPDLISKYSWITRLSLIPEGL